VFHPPEIARWHGRIDDADEGGDARRWHQAIAPLAEDSPPGLALLGFACDAGVRRNHGRPGAAQGPAVLRTALANLAWHGGDTPLFDAGDIGCDDDGLEDAQREYAERLATLLRGGHRVLGIGGGHEIAWAGYQGIASALHGEARLARLGVLNFDAHLDMRPLLLSGDRALGSSGTPFRQIAAARVAAGLSFRYLCVGASRASNTDALVAAARSRDTRIAWDTDCEGPALETTIEQLAAFVRDSSALYLTVCLDVLPASVAPGVSAPAALGLAPAALIAMLRAALAAADGAGIPVIADLAEFAPSLDPDGRSARIAARLLFELAALP
jgi:formiminoglutamase